MLKKLFILFLALPCLSFQTQIKLTIEISELRNNNGYVLLDLQDENKNSIKTVVQKIENKQCTITIHSLKAGKYVFRYFHDENNNKEIDTNWMKIPKEGFGFSNNATGKLGPPSHNKTIFELTTDTTMHCTAQYLK